MTCSPPSAARSILEAIRRFARPTSAQTDPLSDLALGSSTTRSGKLRWRIERDYQELKQEVGLGHFEGHGWRGFQSPTHGCDRVGDVALGL
jgi:SRSO17 transposase